ncbi:MAG: ABC transporter substrate-binding protein [Firmicutes bacterium]|nr:ABC transporter substrate-binding protein [Bacillota bacterium]
MIMISERGITKKVLLIFLFVILMLQAGSICKGKEFRPDEWIIREPGAFPLYPDPAVGDGNIECIAISNIYDVLIFPDPIKGLTPHLATSWEISPDGLKYTFNLRKDVKFHNGDELTAHDVVFSMERLLTIGEGFAYLYLDIDEVKALDKHTVEFTLAKPFGPFLDTLVRLYIVNEAQVMANLEKSGQYGEFGDYGKRWLLTNDAGSGPYMIKEMELESHLLLEKFSDYWGGFEENTPNYVKLISTGEPVTVRTLLARRELEITDMWQPMESLQAAAKLKGVELAYTPCAQNLQIMLNTKRAPTDDIHFRRALAYCMDYDTVAEKIYMGSPVAEGPVPAMLPGHNPDLKMYRKDLEKAKEELKKSRYYNDLNKYPVEIAWVAEVPEEEKIALLFQANAAQIGVKVEIRKKQWGQVIADAQSVETTSHGNVMFVGLHYPEAGSMLKSRYHSSTCGSYEQQEWLGDDQVDALINKALGTIDRDERFAVYAQVQERLVELCPTIWLLDYSEIRAYQAGYVDWPLADHMKAGGEVLCPLLGNSDYFRDMRVYPDKRAELLGK